MYRIRSVLFVFFFKQKTAYEMRISDWSSDVCSSDLFKSIEKTGANSYRVTETCSEGGAAWGTEEHISTNVSTYEIPNNTSFTTKSDSGWESSARYCPQSSLPEPWRNNDIADLIN